MLLTKEYLEQNADFDFLYNAKLVDEINEHVLSDKPLISEVESELHAKLRDLHDKRIKGLLNEQFIWLTLTRDYGSNRCIISRPIVGYMTSRHTFDVSYLKLVKVLRRLENNCTIKRVSVKGPMPKHWYFGAIQEQE